MCLTWQKQLPNQSSEEYKLPPRCNALELLRVLSRFLELPNLISIKLKRTLCLFVRIHFLKKICYHCRAIFFGPRANKRLYLHCLWKRTPGPGDKLDVTHQGALVTRASDALGCMRRNTGGTEGTFPLSSALWDVSGVLAPVLVLSLKGSQGHTCNTSREGPRRGVGSTETVQPGEGKAQGGKYRWGQ